MREITDYLDSLVEEWIEKVKPLIVTRASDTASFVEYWWIKRSELHEDRVSQWSNITKGTEYTAEMFYNAESWEEAAHVCLAAGFSSFETKPEHAWCGDLVRLADDMVIAINDRYPHIGWPWACRNHIPERLECIAPKEDFGVYSLFERIMAEQIITFALWVPLCMCDDSPPLLTPKLSVVGGKL